MLDTEGSVPVGDAIEHADLSGEDVPGLLIDQESDPEALLVAWYALDDVEIAAESTDLRDDVVRKLILAN